jgi:hypothetical protein
LNVTNEGRSLWHIRSINDNVWRFQTKHWWKRTFRMCLSSLYTTQVALTPCHHNSATSTVCTQHKSPSHPVITILPHPQSVHNTSRPHTLSSQFGHIHTHAALLPQYACILKQRERKVNNRTWTEIWMQRRQTCLQLVKESNSFYFSLGMMGRRLGASGARGRARRSPRQLYVTSTQFNINQNNFSISYKTPHCQPDVTVSSAVLALLYAYSRPIAPPPHVQFLQHNVLTDTNQV